MKKIAQLILMMTCLAAMAILAGCGGGGGSASSGTNGTSTLSVYVTDKFGDAYKQVLLTLYSVDLSTDGTTYTNVYSESGGQTLDLKALATVAQFLNSIQVPAGTYTKAKITFSDHVTLVANDGTSTSVAVDPDAGTFANGQVSVVVDTPAKALAGKRSVVVVDFKLASFEVVGSVLRPSVEGHDEGGLEGKQCNGRLRGTISNLSESGFTLNGPRGESMTVNIDANTSITGTLANSQEVFVSGTYDATSNTLTATSIVLDDHADLPKIALAAGAVASVDSANSTFTLTLEHSRGFAPTGGSITVKVDDTTKILAGRGKIGKFADIAVDGKLNVVGAFDAETQTLTANGIHLGQELGHH